MTSKDDLFEEDQSAEEKQPTRPEHTPGELLKAAREAKQLSQQQVADSLRLRVAIIEAIEQDDFDKLAAATFVRGYLRALARALEVDEHKVFEAYEQMGYEKVSTSNLQMQSFSRRKVRERNDNRLMWISYIIIALVIALALVWWWQDSGFRWTDITGSSSSNGSANQVANDGKRSEPVLVETVADKVTTDTTGTRQLTEDEAQQALTTSPDEPDVENAIDNDFATPTDTVTPAEDSTTDQAQNQQSQEPVTQEPIVQQPVVENSDTLVMQFDDACWIKVTDATGEEIAIGVKAAGYRMPLTGQAPFDIILCKPENVTMTFNGEPVDLSSYRRNRSVTMTLGSTSTD